MKSAAKTALRSLKKQTPPQKPQVNPNAKNNGAYSSPARAASDLVATHYSLERPVSPRLIRLINPKCLLRIRRMIHFRSPPMPQHPPMRLTPRRHLIALLGPVRHRSFIAPLQQLTHRLPMRPHHHKRFHRRFRFPTGHRPERIAPIAKHLRSQTPLRLRRLLSNSKRGKDKPWHKQP